jgi:retron-type reverse transcriptase
LEYYDSNININKTKLIKQIKYPWGCSKLIWIPKPGTKVRRPLTIPSFADRMVQEAIRMVLECIYEPVLQSMNCSFGFRAGSGVHQAITCSKASEPRHTMGMTHAIQEDIESAYPNVDRDILTQTIGIRIKDPKFLKSMKNRLKLKLFDTEDKKDKETFLGIPKGGVDSPYLWNIYMLDFDNFILNDIKIFIQPINEKRTRSKEWGQTGKITQTIPRNPISARIERKIKPLRIKISKEKNKEVRYNLFKELKTLKHYKKNKG